MHYFKKNIVWLFSTFSLFISGCGPQKIELDARCLSEINSIYFKGVYPDMYADEVYKILGIPDEKIKVGGDEPGIDLAYYHEKGRILLHCGGVDSDEVGMIEFRPKIRLTLVDITKSDIKIEKENVEFNFNGEHKMTVCFEEDLNTIKEIDWWYK